MSGELILDDKSQWKRTVPAVLLSCLLAGGAAVVCLRHLPLEGSGLAICAAALAYALFRLLYPVCEKLFPAGKTGESGTWTVTPEMLLLNGTAIPRSTIKMVHCWPNRDALGHAKGGWTINIETTGKNHVLRSRTEGEDMERSACQLRAMVEALGYGSQWKESENR